MGAVREFLEEDHARLDRLLDAACRVPGEVDPASYEDFRAGLLRHIAMEEKVLLPAARRAAGGTVPMARQLRLDHSVLAALLVPTPTPRRLEQVRHVLARHNPLEEGTEGVYSVCEGLVGGELSELLSRLNAVPPVPAAAHFDAPQVDARIEHLMRESEAGFASLTR